MSAFSAGRTYRLRNWHSGLYAAVKDNDMKDRARLYQWLRDNGPNNQVWHVFPLDGGAYLITNKNSGLNMKVVNSSTGPDKVEQRFLLPSGMAQAWKLEPVNGTTTYLVRNVNSGLPLKVYGYNARPGAELEQQKEHSAGEGNGYDSQRWVLEVEDEYERVLKPPTFEGADVGDIHRMTDFDRTREDETEHVELANFAYPFPFVHDSTKTVPFQAKESPYYILRKFGYWVRVYYYEHSGASEFTKTETTHVGLTSKNSTTVEETTSISVSAEATFAFKGFGSSIKNTFEKELKVTVTDETVTESWKTVDLTRRYPHGLHVSEAIWLREDKYVLERLDGEGTPIVQWTVRDSTTEKSDSWPKEAVKELGAWRAATR
ncbi:RICIN domain-containing protein [Kitasatospora sp. NPDC036755]|uniref:RICIN domain-containing protein n=1 Tax=Kitasatospora sp. NPDC036755 TaxID=3154600 RepID=UPI0033DA9E3C